MNRFNLKNSGYWLLLFFTWSCIERYTPPPIQSINNYLVVDGFINAGTGPTTFNLTRTRNLSEAFKPVVESNASVWVEGENGDSYQLSEKNPGEYAIQELNLNQASNYRLRIRTRDSKEYVSAFVPVIQTPAIDSVNWGPADNAVQIYINTHDPENKVWHYLWKFHETWEYRAPMNSTIEYVNKSIEIRPSANQIYTCWQQSASTNIFLGSSARLNEAIIYQYPLILIPASRKLSIKYSILVKQYGISEEGFQYWQLLKKNTETTGSIFDAQPSQLTGNITCVNNPQEPVIGFVSAGLVQEKRVYILRSQIRHINLGAGPGGCMILDTIPNMAMDLEEAFESFGYVPVEGLYGMSGFLGWGATTQECVDCRVYGGTTTKPDFWQ